MQAECQIIFDMFGKNTVKELTADEMAQYARHIIEEDIAFMQSNTEIDGVRNDANSQHI